MRRKGFAGCCVGFVFRDGPGGQLRPILGQRGRRAIRNPGPEAGGGRKAIEAPGRAGGLAGGCTLPWAGELVGGLDGLEGLRDPLAHARSR